MTLPPEQVTECAMTGTVGQRKMRHFQWGNVGCGYCMSATDKWIRHVFAFVFAVTVFIFNYAALLQTGNWVVTAGGFVMGIVLLFFLYGQSVDQFYIHFGEKVKVGAEAYHDDSEESVQVAFDQE